MLSPLGSIKMSQSPIYFDNFTWNESLCKMQYIMGQENSTCPSTLKSRLRCRVSGNFKICQVLFSCFYQYTQRIQDEQRFENFQVLIVLMVIIYWQQGWSCDIIRLSIHQSCVLQNLGCGNLLTHLSVSFINNITVTWK